MSPDDAADCNVDVQTSVDLPARRLTDEEQQRMPSALHRQREEILPASDTEREIMDTKRSLRESELRLSTLRHRHRIMDATPSLATSKHDAIQPVTRLAPKHVAMQP